MREKRCAVFKRALLKLRIFSLEMLQTRDFLIISVLCTSFVGGCFSSGTTNATREVEKSDAEALALELNDNSVRMPPKLNSDDLNDDEKLKKVSLL